MSEMTSLKQNTELTTLGEIADTYGYQRSSIGVMTQRYADFPKPVGIEAKSKYYSRTEVEAWFIAYNSRGGKKYGNGRSGEGRGITHRGRNPLLEEILSRIGGDLVLQSKVLLYLEEVKES
jgi:predicted DNA-binding transcriptional regulator AlpA